MAPTAAQENLITKNKAYANTFTKGDLPIPPAKSYTIVTCMDARINTFEAFGVDLGDAHIIRNAGGNAKDALRSLVISEQLLGTTEIFVIKHTGCGMLTFDNDAAIGLVKKNLGDSAVSELSAFNSDFQPWPKLEEAVKDDVSFLKRSALIPDNVTISGWVYECETGKVVSVV